MSKTLDQVRQAVEASGKSRYRIWQDTGIDQSQLSRLMSGQAGLSYDALERLCEYLGLEIVVRPKRRTRKRES